VPAGRSLRARTGRW